MSVINEMLRDLDTRRQRDGGVALDSLRLEAEADDRRRRNMGLFFLVVVALLVSAGGSMIWFEQQRLAKRTASFQPPAVANPRASAPDAAQVVAVPSPAPTAEPAASEPSLDDGVASLVAAPADTTTLEADSAITAPLATATTAPASSLVTAPAPAQPPAATAGAPADATPAVSEPAPHAPQPLVAAAPTAVAPSGATGAAPEVMEKSATRLAPRDRAEQAYHAGVALLSAGDQRAGERELRNALAAEPRHILARERLSALLLRQGRNDDAEQVLAQGMEVLPAHGNFAKLRADLRLKRGDLYGALSVLITHVPPLAQDPDHHAMTAAVLQQMGDHGQAEQSYRALTQVQPREAKHWAGLAISLDQLGRGEEALNAYARARKLGLTGEVARYVDARIGVLAARYR